MRTLDETARLALLRSARAAIARAIGLEQVPTYHASDLPTHCAGAFVTLLVGGELRGCIGYPDPDLPLAETVERCAISAATSDPRFPAVDFAEWPLVGIEISVLGEIEPVSDVSEIDVGRHGVIVELGARRGLLLPQVAVERKWNSAEFVAQTCQKAGLPSDGWRLGATVYRFEADVFGE